MQAATWAIVQASLDRCTNGWGMEYTQKHSQQFLLPSLITIIFIGYCEHSATGTVTEQLLCSDAWRLTLWQSNKPKSWELTPDSRSQQQHQPPKEIHGSDSSNLQTIPSKSASFKNVQACPAASCFPRCACNSSTTSMLDVHYSRDTHISALTQHWIASI